MFEDVLRFWFEEIDPRLWWNGGVAFDAAVNDRFAELHAQASRAELAHWRQKGDGRGRLAEIIVLDQFSRNIYRDSMRAFAQDGMALVLAQEAVALGLHSRLPAQQAAFLMMPYMHSESGAIHAEAESLFRDYAPEGNYKFELLHKAVIDRFGRYPHRNVILGRSSTLEEIEFLKQPGSRF